MACSSFAPARPAGAAINGPCAATAEVNGKLYTPAHDTPGNPIRLPKRGTILYQGTTRTVTSPHHGSLAVSVGPTRITIYSWASTNAKRKLSAAGHKDLASTYAKLPFSIAGIYRITGYHYSQGRLYCSGFAYVAFDQSPFVTPVGVFAEAGTVLTAAGLVLAARGRARR